MAFDPTKAPNPSEAAGEPGSAEQHVPEGKGVGSARPGDRRLVIRGIVETAVTRLAGVIEEETAALRSRAAPDLKPFNDRKSLGLIELNKALRLLEGSKPDRYILDLISDLNSKLETNRHVVKLHLEAVREIATIIAQSIRDAESDGTYTLAFRSKGQAP